jgi:hypothetical protein
MLCYVHEDQCNHHTTLTLPVVRVYGKANPQPLCWGRVDKIQPFCSVSIEWHVHTFIARVKCCLIKFIPASFTIFHSCDLPANIWFLILNNLQIKAQFKIIVMHDIYSTSNNYVNTLHILDNLLIIWWLVIILDNIRRSAYESIRAIQLLDKSFGGDDIIDWMSSS